MAAILASRESAMRLKVSRYTHVLNLSSGGALLYNGRTGAIAELSVSGLKRVRSLFEHVSSGKVRHRPSDLLESLAAGGFVVQEDVNELELIRERYESSRQGSQFLFTILPTFACNLGCDYCFVGKKSGNMSEEVQDGI